MKNINKKQKIVLSIILGAIILTIGVVLIVKNSNVNTFNKDEDKEQLPKVEQKEELNFELTLLYKETPKNEYIVNVENEEIAIITNNITPEIDTNTIGNTKHTTEINGDIVNISITVEDNREIIIPGEKKFTIEANSVNLASLEKIMITEFTKNEIIEGDELLFNFKYPANFSLDIADEYEITVTAKFINNSKNMTTESIMIIVEPTLEPSIPEPTNTPSKPKPTSNPSKPKPTTKPAKPTAKPAKPTAKPAKPTTKPEPTRPPAPTLLPEPTPKPKGDSVIEKDPPIKGKPEVPVPAGVPKEAELSYESNSEHKFNYDYVLPNGRKVEVILVVFNPRSASDNPRINMIGLDNSGKRFRSIYNREGLSFSAFGIPDLDNEDKDALRELGSQWLDFYGL